MFRFNHEAHEGHKVKILEDFSKTFVHLRALCGEKESLTQLENIEHSQLVRLFRIVPEKFGGIAC
jgi:hypothetical protein